MNGKSLAVVFFFLAAAAPSWAKPWAPNEQKLKFWRQDTQKHFWLSATGTYVGTQVFRSFGLSLGPSVGLSATGILGLGIAKEFLHDPTPSKNDLMADSLGIALGTLASFTIRFDGYFDGKNDVTVKTTGGYRDQGAANDLLPTRDVGAAPPDARRPASK